MKPTAFEWVQVSTVEEALALLGEEDREARLLAGGQSLIPMMNFRLASPDLLIDINQVMELKFITEHSGELHVGAMARQRELEKFVADRPHWSLLEQALKRVGHAPIRNRGTLGGSLAHADPAAELGLVSLALGAQLTARSASGSREIPVEDFFVSHYTTILEPGEILTQVRYPVQPEGAGASLHEVARRQGDFALVSVAAIVSVSSRGEITSARLAYGSMGPRPLRAYDTETALVGQPATREVFAEAAQSIEGQLHPGSDLHASSSYRMDVAKALTRRALMAASSACAVPSS